MNKLEIRNNKVDKYGSLIVSTPKLNNPKKSKPFSLSFVYPNDDIPLRKCQKTSKPIFIIKNFYFIYNCKTNEDGSQDLILNGHDLYKRIGLNKRYYALDINERKKFYTKYFSGDAFRIGIFLI
jgi:hypothetical protein